LRKKIRTTESGNPEVAGTEDIQLKRRISQNIMLKLKGLATQSKMHNQAKDLE
jgi:hypothetical protein